MQEFRNAVCPDFLLQLIPGLGSSAALSVCFAAGFLLLASRFAFNISLYSYTFLLHLYFFNLRSECLTGALGGDADSRTTEVPFKSNTLTHKVQIHKYEYANTKLEGDDDSRTTEAPFKFNTHIPPSPNETAPITNAN